MESRLLSAWKPLWQIPSELKIDESLLAHYGETPGLQQFASAIPPPPSPSLHSYIIRKPHPFGLIQWSSAAQSARFGIPIILSFSWDRDGRRVTAHEALQLANADLSPRLGRNHPHWIADSAWGSEKMIQWLQDHGASATFSMPITTRPGLWDCLEYELGLDEGRAVIDPSTNIIYSVMLVKNDKKETILLKTATTGATLGPEDEPRVLAILGRRQLPRGGFEYQAKLSDGTTEWLGPASFISDDGSINIDWLDKAQEEDLRSHFSSMTKEQLEYVCEMQGWKARTLISLTSPLQRSGNKSKLIDRVVRRSLAVTKNERDWAQERLRSALGAPVSMPFSRVA